jgi:ATP-dependent DNA helicase RecQ
VDSDDLLRGIRVVLSGVARMHGRFGKQLVAQMLCGSKNKKLQQWKLHRLSTYGLLAVLKQSEVSDAIDVLVQCGLIEQREVDQRRPTIHLTELGDAVMRETEPLPAAVEFRFPLAKRLAVAARSVGGGASPASAVEAAGAGDGAGGGSPEADELRDRLRRFRRKRSAALGVPPYRVLTNATIDRLVEAPPQTISELEAVPGIGPSTIEAFGHDLLELIAETCGVPEADTAASVAARPIVTEPSGETPASDPLEAYRQRDDAATVPDNPPPAADGNGAMNDACWTWRLFRDGYTADQVRQIRRSDRRGVDEDLIAAALAGRPVEPGWAEAAETRRRLEEIRAGGQ